MNGKQNNVFKNIITAVVLMMVMAVPASATGGGLQGSNIYNGFLNFINDLTVVLTILCPLVGGAAALVFIMRRSMADEQDGKMWTKRATTAIICGVGGGLISGFIALLTSYF